MSRVAARPDSEHVPGVLRLFLFPGRMVYAGPGVDAEAHAHHAFQLTVAVAGDAAFDVGDGFVRAPLTVIPPDRQHAQRASNAIVVSVYVEPESVEGRALSTLARERSTASIPVQASELPTWTACDAWDWSSKLLDAVSAGSSAAPMDERVARAVGYIREHLEEGDLSLRAIGKNVGLSAGRLSHLFPDQVGIPIRPYVLWLRLQRAADALARGSNLTEAAHAAGFADAAHLSRTFRRMFGIPPSLVATTGAVIAGRGSDGA